MTNVRPGRSGQWLPTGDIANLPSHLRAEGAFRPAPLREDIRLRRGTYQAASRASEALGRLDEAAARLPNRGALVRLTQIREAEVSFDLDKLFYSLSEIMAMDLPDVDVQPPVDPAVLRLRRADDDAVDRVRRGDPVGRTLLCRTAAILADVPVPSDDIEVMDRVPWRTDHRWLGGPAAADAYLQCVPPGAELHASVAEWLTWLDETSDLPVVVRLALGHYQLAVLAPVANAQHLSRLLIPLVLIQEKTMRDQILAPSMWFSRRNGEYRRQLRAVVDSGEFDSWVTFFADGVHELCVSQIEFVYQLEEVGDRLLGKLSQRNDGLARLVTALIGNPVFNTQLAMKLSGLGDRQVHTLVTRLEKAGIVRKMDRNRLIRKKNSQVVREVPDVVKVIGMFDHLPFRRDRSVFDA